MWNKEQRERERRKDHSAVFELPSGFSLFFSKTSIHLILQFVTHLRYPMFYSIEMICLPATRAGGFFFPWSSLFFFVFIQIGCDEQIRIDQWWCVEDFVFDSASSTTKTHRWPSEIGTEENKRSIWCLYPMTIPTSTKKSNNNKDRKKNEEREEKKKKKKKLERISSISCFFSAFLSSSFWRIFPCFWSLSKHVY